MKLCLGCGKSYDPLCADCEAAAAKIIAASHWPMETSLTPAALAHVESAVRERLVNDRVPRALHTELHNLVANIRAHLQHVVGNARPAEPTDEDLLS